MIEGWCSGCCEPRNPGGHAAFGIVVKVDDKTVIARSGYVGYGREMSTNVAYFAGFIALIEEIAKLKGPAMIRTDSKLTINTLLGKWKAQAGLYIPFFTQARHIYEIERDRIGLEWISRDENSECDVLSKKEITDRGIRLRIQPSGKHRRRGSASSFPDTVEELKAAGYVIRHENVPCRGCNAAIDFYTTPLGKKIPVDHATATPHFKTCPKAEDFRRSKN